MNDKWTVAEAKQLRASARQCFKHYGHNSSRLERENCSTCVLNGYEPRGGYEEGYSVRRDGPNYAGWARVFVEAGYLLPKKWKKAFEAERYSENTAYAEALEKSIRTFGEPVFV